MKPEYNKWISGKGAGVYSAFDISSYIIEYSNEKQYIISGLKLQKLLYFVQAYFLIQKKEPCFREKLIAWNFGPVVVEVYEKYKEYGSLDIPKDRAGAYYVDEADKELIKYVVDAFAYFPATTLTDTAIEQLPYQKAVASSEKEIKIQDIRDFFNEDNA